MKNEGSEVVTNCHQLKMLAQDEKMRLTDVAYVETILRLKVIPRHPKMTEPQPKINAGHPWWKVLKSSVNTTL